ncbi:hypothetical protein SRHO_G00270170 [Serrasalmus rhombeus]
MWVEMVKRVQEVVEEVIGSTKPGRRYIDKQVWWWNEEVQEAIKAKKLAFKTWWRTRMPEDFSQYRFLKLAAKQVVASAKSQHYQDMYDQIDTPEGANSIYRLVKARHRAVLDVDTNHIVQIKGPNGQVLRNQQRRIPAPTNSTRRPSHRACQADHHRGTLFNRIVAEDTPPKAWTTSITVPIWKGKGDATECINYRLIRLLCHAMKIFERVLDKRIRQVVTITPNQCGFVKGRGTTDTIHAVRLLMEKH